MYTLTKGLLEYTWNGNIKTLILLLQMYSKHNDMAVLTTKIYNNNSFNRIEKAGL
jgi:hypothetical protein